MTSAGCRPGGADQLDDDAVLDDDHEDDDTGSPPLPELIIPCKDLYIDLYVEPDDLPPWGPSVLGDVVRCTPGEVIPREEVVQRLQEAGVLDLEPISGARSYHIGYRTTRWEGEPGFGMARVFLPDTAHPDGPLPLIIANHGSMGLADWCAPSLNSHVMDYLVLPFVGLGFAVVAPDYAGLGTDGTQGYGDYPDTARSVIDAGRAARKAVVQGSFAPGTIAAGHSQGGGASLTAHALAESYGDGDLLAAIGFAPHWITGTGEIGAVLDEPEAVPFEGLVATATAMMLYADAANFLEPGMETAYFRYKHRQAFADALEMQCLITLVDDLPLLADTYADALDPEFAGTAAACIAGEPACAPPGEGFVQRLEHSVMDVDADGGPILLLQGGQDTTITPEDTACIADALVDGGIVPQVCTLDDAGHGDIVDRTIAFAVEWSLALHRGEALPPCAASELPPCY